MHAAIHHDILRGVAEVGHLQHTSFGHGQREVAVEVGGRPRSRAFHQDGCPDDAQPVGIEHRPGNGLAIFLCVKHEAWQDANEQRQQLLQATEAYYPLSVFHFLSLKYFMDLLCSLYQHPLHTVQLSTAHLQYVNPGRQLPAQHKISPSPIG